MTQSIARPRTAATCELLVMVHMSEG